MAGRLFKGQRWRRSARRLSLPVPDERERAGFQLGLVKDSPWGAFGSPREKEEQVAALEEIFKRLSLEQGDRGA